MRHGLLEEDPEEVNALYKDLLIGVTRFLRDREAFATLASVLPQLVQQVAEGEIRAWVAGAATGEEGYSVAILLRESLDALGRDVPVKIFATDLHRASLEFASAALYPEASLADMSLGHRPPGGPWACICSSSSGRPAWWPRRRRASGGCSTSWRRSAASSPRLPTRPQKGPAQRRRTLIVEDDANERELLAAVLGMNGCESDTAADGQEALDYLSSHEPPDLLLLDMSLPRVSGPQTLGRMRQEPRWQGVKVCAVSGEEPADLGVSGGGGGVDAWFRKPLSPSRLREVLRLGLGTPSAPN